MSDRVLSSQAAKDAITALQNIINGGLQNEINNLNQQGNQLKDPNNWDGPCVSSSTRFLPIFSRQVAAPKPSLVNAVYRPAPRLRGGER